MDSCLFCSIASDNTPHHEIIWSDENHIAFLAVPPSKDGHTLIIPRQHSTGILDLSGAQYADIFAAAIEVSVLLHQKLNCERIAVVVEGASVPHTHIHLIPLMADEKLATFTTLGRTDAVLATLAEKIRP
ncbi:MAG: HIT family protein [Bacteroidetes bacterium]|nr:HIT family protein [Bacteroidota bacterium]